MSSLAPRTNRDARRALLADPKLYEDLRRYVRARVPGGEDEDVVHAALADALAAENAPGAAEEVRRWVFGIARNKAADHFRRIRGLGPLVDVEQELAAENAPHAAHDLLKWAVQELPQDASAHDTLQWMLQEGEGDPLEEIARENQLPAPRLRKRVSRLRRYYRSRWSALAALGLLGLLAVVGYRWLAREQGREAPSIAKETPRPLESAPSLREVTPRSLAPNSAQSSAAPANPAPIPSQPPTPPVSPSSSPSSKPKTSPLQSEKPRPTKVAPGTVSNGKVWDKKTANWNGSSLDSFPDPKK
ncbi:MAG TPA: hypothetical protein VG937_22345 [Polyangiaceae bacterium]|nr:hypothetical protein [Polyangiaceae bacterium]